MTVVNDDHDDELTPIEPVRHTTHALRLSGLCSQHVVNQLLQENQLKNALASKMTLETIRPIVQEWMLLAMRQAGDLYRGELERAGERLLAVQEDLILARSCAVRNAS